MEGRNFDITYVGEIRTRMIHLKSGNEVVTDAPEDNNGKAQAFSPTDLVASGLAACMLTVIGIYFDKRDRALEVIHCQVKKVMITNPRRIAEVHVEFDFGSNVFSPKEMQVISNLALNCPVANSLSKDVLIKTNLH